MDQKSLVRRFFMIFSAFLLRLCLRHKDTYFSLPLYEMVSRFLHKIFQSQFLSSFQQFFSFSPHLRAPSPNILLPNASKEVTHCIGTLWERDPASVNPEDSTYGSRHQSGQKKHWKPKNCFRPSTRRKYTKIMVRMGKQCCVFHSVSLTKLLSRTLSMV